MKKLLLATLVLTTSISAAYAAGPTIYGKINASVDDVKSDLNSNRSVSVDSNASRFGIRGNEKLTDSLSAIYQIEWGVAIDHNTVNANTDANSNGSTADLTARTRFIGLQYDGIGAIKIGRLDTNVKNLQYVNPAQGIDILDDYVNGTFDTTQTFAGENRVDNVVAFETAKFDTGFGTFQGNFLISPSEKTVPEGAKGSTGSTSTSTSIIFTNKDFGLYTGLGYDSNIASYWNATSTLNTAAVAAAAAKTNVAVITPTRTTTNTFRWVGSADLDKLVGATGLTVNALAQQSKQTNLASGAVAPKETAYLLSADYNFKALGFEALTAKLQWQNATTSNLVVNGSDVKIDQFGVDLDYAFSAKTKVYGFIAQRTIKNPNNPVTATNGYDQNYKYSAFGVGLEQKF